MCITNKIDEKKNSEATKTEEEIMTLCHNYCQFGCQLSEQGR